MKKPVVTVTLVEHLSELTQANRGNSAKSSSFGRLVASDDEPGDFDF